MRVFWVVVVFCVSVAGCFDGAPGAGARVSCSSSLECPAPLRCVAERGQCFSIEEIAGDVCGDGFVGGGEACDDGVNNSDVVKDACRSDCRVARCGDGVIDSDENCDDGNTADGDDCPSSCVEVICGDEVVVAPEVCDDGNQRSGDGCRADCLKAEVCGDAVIDDGEGCDDGNANDNDGCSACRDVDFVSSLVTGDGLEGSVASRTALLRPRGIAVASDGSLYVVDAGQRRLLRVASDGVVEVVAGAEGATGSDGGPAVLASLASPTLVAVAGDDRVFVVDDDGKRVRVIRRDGIIEAFAGDLDAPFDSGDGGAAAAAGFGEITDIGVDGDGGVVVYDDAARRARRVDDAGVITCFSGCSGFIAFDGADREDGRWSSATRLTVGFDGDVYIADASTGIAVHIEGDVMELLVSVDGGAAVNGALANETDLSSRIALVDGQGPLVIDTERRIWRITDGRLSQVITDVPLGSITDFAVDGRGGLLMTESDHHRVLRVKDGVTEVVVGTGAGGFVGEGGAARHVRFDHVRQGDRDALGVLIADAASAAVYRVDDAGIVTRVFGGGTSRAPARGVDVGLEQADSVVSDGAGGFVVADGIDAAVYAVDGAGDGRLIAGGRQRIERNEGDGGPATEASFSSPTSVDIDAAGRIVIMDSGDNLLRRIEADGRIVTVAGGLGIEANSGDGGPAVNASFDRLASFALAPDGRIVIATSSTIRLIAADGTISTISGEGRTPAATGVSASDAEHWQFPEVDFDSAGHVVIVALTGIFTIVDGALVERARTDEDRTLGDGGTIDRADIGFCSGLRQVGDDLLYSDFSHGRVRLIDAAGVINTVAGDTVHLAVGAAERAAVALAASVVALPGGAVVTGGSSRRLMRVAAGSVEVVAGSDDGVVVGAAPVAAATADLLGEVGGLAADGARLYVAESGRNRILQIDLAADVADWRVSVFAGGDDAGFVDGSRADARFAHPAGLAVDPGVALFVADRDNQVVRRIDLVSGAVSTFAGRPRVRSFDGDGGPARSAALNRPEAVALGNDGSVFIADRGNQRVRRVDSAGVMSTVLGDGSSSSSGEGAPSVGFPIEAPRGLATDTFGNVLVTSPTTVRLLAARDGVVDGTGAVLTLYGRPPRTGPVERRTHCLGGIAHDPDDDGRFYVVDTCAGALIALDRADAEAP